MLFFIDINLIRKICDSVLPRLSSLMLKNHCRMPMMMRTKETAIEFRKSINPSRVEVVIYLPKMRIWFQTKKL